MCVLGVCENVAIVRCVWVWIGHYGSGISTRYHGASCNVCRNSSVILRKGLTMEQKGLWSVYGISMLFPRRATSHFPRLDVLHCLFCCIWNMWHFGTIDQELVLPSFVLYHGLLTRVGSWHKTGTEKYEGKTTVTLGSWSFLVWTNRFPDLTVAYHEWSHQLRCRLSYVTCRA